MIEIKLANKNKAMAKHEVIKLLLCIHLKNRFKTKNFYKDCTLKTEHQIGKRKADVFFSRRQKEEYAFEIQKRITKKWRKEIEEDYLEQDVYPVIIPVDDMPDDIEGILRELEKYI